MTVKELMESLGKAPTQSKVYLKITTPQFGKKVYGAESIDIRTIRGDFPTKHIVYIEHIY